MIIITYQQKKQEKFFYLFFCLINQKKKRQYNFEKTLRALDYHNTADTYCLFLKKFQSLIAIFHEIRYTENVIFLKG